MDEKKRAACAEVDRMSRDLVAVSRNIYDHPEERFEEHHASRLLADALKKGGFEVALGVAGLPTAIHAVHPAASAGPTVALLAEYDALPELGHACGHNLIAASALGACLALVRLKGDLPGRLLFLGTPAEEGGGGKVTMVREGIFARVDAAMMFHPASYTVVDRASLAISEVVIEFTGVAAHAASSPERGVNALDAVIQTFNGLSALRQHIKDGARVHGIITNGGAKPNIVPEHASALFYVRARENAYRDELLLKLRRCAEGAALSTGATLSFRVEGHSYQAMRPNLVLGRAFAANLAALGEPLDPPEERGLASTDMGDVSQTVPAIHPYIRIASKEVAGHSRAFAEASVSSRGEAVMLTAAKTLAMTAIDLFARPDLVAEVKAEFARSA